MTFMRDSLTPADGDYLGQLKFKAKDDANQETVMAKITAKISDATNLTEDGLLEFSNRKAGTNTITARLTSTDLKLINGTGLEVDGDVGIATTSPLHKLQVGDFVSTSTLGTIGIKSDANNHAILIEEPGASSEFWGIGVDASGDLNFYNSGSSTPSVVFNDDGNVGIGTTSPGEKLQVEGDVLISGSGGTIGTSGQITNGFLKIGTEDLELTLTKFSSQRWFLYKHRNRNFTFRSWWFWNTS